MKKVIVLSSVGSFFATLLAIFVFNSFVNFYNRPTVEGIANIDGNLDVCVKAYDRRGSRDCEEVVKGGYYRFLPVDPSHYGPPSVTTGPATLGGHKGTPGKTKI